MHAVFWKRYYYYYNDIIAYKIGVVGVVYESFDDKCNTTRAWSCFKNPIILNKNENRNCLSKNACKAFRFPCRVPARYNSIEFICMQSVSPWKTFSDQVKKAQNSKREIVRAKYFLFLSFFPQARVGLRRIAKITEISKTSRFWRTFG